MSVHVASGGYGSVVHPDVLASPASRPITVLTFGKRQGFEGSSTFIFNRVRLCDSTNSSYFYGHQWYMRAASFLTLDAQTVDSGASLAATRLETSNSGFSDQWIGCLTVHDTVNSNEQRSYMQAPDGSVLPAAAPQGSRTVQNASELYLSCGGSNNYWTRLARVAIWLGLPTQDQIEALLSGSSPLGDDGAFGDLAGYWEMDQDWAATGGVIPDLSGNGNHITPPAGWTYNADQPELMAAAPSIALTSASPVEQHKLASFNKVNWTETVLAATMGGVEIIDIADLGATVDVRMPGSLADGAHTLTLEGATEIASVDVLYEQVHETAFPPPSVDGDESTYYDSESVFKAVGTSFPDDTWGTLPIIFSQVGGGDPVTIQFRINSETGVPFTGWNDPAVDLRANVSDIVRLPAGAAGSYIGTAFARTPDGADHEWTVTLTAVQKRIVKQLVARNGEPLSGQTGIAASIFAEPATGAAIAGSPIVALTDLAADIDGTIVINDESLSDVGESVIVVLDSTEDNDGVPLRRLGVYVTPVIDGLAE